MCVSTIPGETGSRAFIDTMLETVFLSNKVKDSQDV